MSTFYTHIIGGGDVGSSLSRALQALGLPFKSHTYNRQEQAAVASAIKPVFVLLTQIAEPVALDDADYWLEQAKLQDATVVLVSSLCMEGAPEESLAWLADLEARVGKLHRHMILRQGEVLSFQPHSLVSRLLVAMRHDVSLTLDDTTRFSPSPAEDVASVTVAMIQQAMCSQNLWGTYEFGGDAPVTVREFADILLAQASQHEGLATQSIVAGTPSGDFSASTSAANNERLFHCFGIQPKPWGERLVHMLEQHYNPE